MEAYDDDGPGLQRLILLRLRVPEKDERSWLVAIIEKHLDQWFDRSLNPCNPNMWDYKAALKEEWRARSGLTAEEARKADEKRKADNEKEEKKHEALVVEYEAHGGTILHNQGPMPCGRLEDPRFSACAQSDFKPC